MPTFSINARVGDHTQHVVAVIDVDGPAPPEVAHVLRMAHDSGRCAHPMCRACADYTLARTPTLTCPTSDEIDAWHEANPTVTWQAGFWLAVMDRPQPLNELQLSGWAVGRTWLTGVMER